MTGLVDVPSDADAVRIVAYEVSNPVEKPDDALGIVLSAFSGPFSKLLYRRGLEVEKFG